MIYGRDVELKSITKTYEQMLAGKGSVLFLTGEAGLGKTTLVRTWWEQVQSAAAAVEENATGGALYVESACSIPIGNVDVGKLEALQPWADVIAKLNDLGTNPTGQDVPAQKPSKAGKVRFKDVAAETASTWALAVPLVGGLAHAVLETRQLMKAQRALSEKINLKQLVHDAAPAWAWALPVVGDVLHAAAETARVVHEKKKDAPSPTGHGAVNQQQVFQQYVNLLSSIAEEVPLVVFLDDCHWADESSCNLLFYLSRQIASKRILVIGTYRADDALTANEGKGHPILTVKNELLRYETGSVLEVGALTADAIHSILLSRCPAMQPDTPGDRRFEDWLLHISAGNSLFVTQFISTLREDGHLSESGMFSGEYEKIAIPRTALAVVEERARRLDAATRQLLSYATVEGEEFSAYVLARITEMKMLALLAELRKAQQTGFVVPHGSAKIFADQATALFGFSHALMHKVLYDGLIDAEREFLHRQCYDILHEEWKRLADGNQPTGTLAGRLLIHAEHCGEWEVVAHVATTAAERLWKQYSADEALGMVERGLAAWKSGGDSLRQYGARALLLRAKISEHRWKTEDSLRDARQAEEIFHSEGNHLGEVDAMSWIGLNMWQARRFEEAITETKRLLDRSRETGIKISEAQAHNQYGLIARDTGKFTDSLREFQEAMEIRRSIGNEDGVAGALINIGTVYNQLQQREEALKYTMEGLEMSERLGHTMWVANALGNSASMLLTMGRYDEADALIKRNLILRDKMGDRSGRLTTINDLGLLEMERGRYEEGLACFGEAIELSKEINFPMMEAGARINSGELLLRLGRFEEARQYCEQGLVIAREIKHFWEAYALIVRGSIGIAQKFYEEAIGDLDAAYEILKPRGVRPVEFEVFMGRAECYVSLHQYALAHKNLDECVTIAKEANSEVLEARARCMQAKLSVAESGALPASDRRVILTKAIVTMEQALVEVAKAGRKDNVNDWNRDLNQIKEMLEGVGGPVGL